MRDDVVDGIAELLVRHFSWAHSGSRDPVLVDQCREAAGQLYRTVVRPALTASSDRARVDRLEILLQELSDLDDIGLRLGIDQASDRHDYLRRYERIFADFGPIDRLGLIVGTDRGVDIANVFAEFLPQTQVTVASYVPARPGSRLRPGVDLVDVQNAGAAHRQFAAAGPLDILIEDSPNKKSMKRDLFVQLFAHVRAGGLYIVEDLHASHLPAFVDDDGESIWELVSRLVDMKVAGKRWAGRRGPDDVERARAIASVRFDAKLLVVERSGSALLKLRHTEDTILTRRYGSSWGRRVHTEKAEVIDSPAIGVTNDPTLRDARYPQRISVPPLHLREYLDVVVRPQGLLIKDNYLLPDTFRLWQAHRQVHNQLRDISHYFAWEPAPSTTPHLPGRFYYLDLEYNRHFGHMMTEGLGRLWAWEEARTRYPDVKLIMSALHPYQEALLAAFGIARDDIVVVDGPVHVDHLLAPMGGFHIGRYVSSRMREVYRAIQDGLDAPSTPSFDKVFLIRQEGLWRECRNHTELEQLFVAHGYELVKAEDYDIAGQAALFRHARVVAGYTGSGLYGSLMRTEPLQLIGFVNPSYLANNEYLLASALGHTLHQFWGKETADQRTSDVAGRAIGPTNYDYVFDFDRDGAQLEALLDDLDVGRGVVHPGARSDRLR